MARKAKVVVPAPKAPRVTKAERDAIVSTFIKAIVPKDLDAKYHGDEPAFPVQPEASERSIQLLKGFNWYNYFFSKKEAKQMVLQYLTQNKKVVDAKSVGKVPDSEFITTYGWLARMTMRGLELSKEEQAKLDAEVERLKTSLTEGVQHSQTGGKGVKKAEKPEAPVSKRPNVQEIMREKAMEASGELEGVFDDFLDAGCKSKATAKTVELLTKYTVMPQHVPMIVDVWKRKQAEYEEVVRGKDSQLVEAYSHRTKTQLKNILAFIESVLGDLANYVNLKKASKAPRKRKPVPVEKLVAKLKYMKSFTDEQAKLNLVSVHPSKLVGSSEAWVYDTSKRKLYHFVAEEYSKTFSVKGNTLLGFDSNQSEMKTLRKPAEQLKEIMGGKPAARKFFKEIKAVSTTPNGRFTAAMVILKCF